MNNPVVIKSNKYGLLIHLDSESSYEDLLVEIEKKFLDAAKFFSGAKMAVSFEGRHLTKEEEQEIVNLISQSAHIHIICIIDNDKLKETFCKNIVTRHLEFLNTQDGKFYKGTLRKRQVLECEKSIIIIGNVDAGATVVAKGNIIVLGTAKGKLHAGASGRKNSFIAALSLQPTSLCIADIKAKHLLKRPKDTISTRNPEIAVLDGKHIYIDPLVYEK